MGSGVSPMLLSPEEISGKLGQGQHQERKLSKAIRLISTTRLKPLLALHLWPINVVVSNEPYCHIGREILSQGGLRAYMLSALILSERSYPALPLTEQLVH